MQLPGKERGSSERQIRLDPGGAFKFFRDLTEHLTKACSRKNSYSVRTLGCRLLWGKQRKPDGDRDPRCMTHKTPYAKGKDAPDLVQQGP
ncbi:hypothetical protein MACH18_34250 [Phaeobacter italicus]|nr:hypothetical protein MACH18_34250 [Phaeobacter italicus]